MNILVTGSGGFIGKNLIAGLKNIKSGKDKTRKNIKIEEIFEYDINTGLSLLDKYCEKADFIFNLAGINRPENNEEFIRGNSDFIKTLLDFLKKHKNTCPVMLASSVQASLTGRYEGSEYGKSKLAGEKRFFDYEKETGAKILIYRFPNVFGKWCRPNYNSAIATFCNNIANGLPVKITNEKTELKLLYIDDLVNEMLDALEGNEHHCEFDGINAIFSESGKYCFVPKTYKTTLGEIVKLLEKFRDFPDTLLLPEIPENSFEKKLLSTYISYLPKEKISFPLKMNVDERGSFTELLKTENGGQFSVNVSKPGVTKGEHWHNTKWEFFIVVSGRALICQRKIGSDEILSFEVSGDKIEAVYMLPGYTHNIKNLSDTENLVTLMWANENFNLEYPDTFGEKVEEK